MILAFQQEFIDKKTFDRCGKLAQKADNKPRAVIEFLNQGHMKKPQFQQRSFFQADTPLHAVYFLRQLRQTV